MRSERRLPDRVSFHVEGEQPVVGEVDVDVFAVGHRRFRGVAVLPVAASERMAAIELPLPERFPGLEIETKEMEADLDLFGQLAVTGVEPPVDFFGGQPLGLQFGDVVVAEIRAERRALHFAGTGGRGQEDPVPPDDRR